MKNIIINPPNNWDYWTAAQKEELKAAQNQKKVGSKIVFENETCRVWTTHLPSGHRLPFHKHSIPYFWTALKEGKARSFYNDGSVAEITYEVNDTVDFKDLNEMNYFIHSLENIGDTTLVFTVVEFLNKKAFIK